MKCIGFNLIQPIKANEPNDYKNVFFFNAYPLPDIRHQHGYLDFICRCSEVFCNELYSQIFESRNSLMRWSFYAFHLHFEAPDVSVPAFQAVSNICPRWSSFVLWPLVLYLENFVVNNCPGNSKNASIQPHFKGFWVLFETSVKFKTSHHTKYVIFAIFQLSCYWINKI